MWVASLVVWQLGELTVGSVGRIRRLLGFRRGILWWAEILWSREGFRAQERG